MGINHKLNAEGKITGGSEITIDTTDIWHHITNIAAGDVYNGLSFGAGSENAITVFADGGSGQVIVTSAAHGISEGHHISIAGTTNYNGLFQVTSVTTDTFEITDTWVSDDGTGTLRYGSRVNITTGQGGDYIYLGAISATSAAANNTFEFSFILNNSTNGVTRRKFATNTDVGSISMQGFFHAETGDQISIALRNITGAANVTINEASVIIFRIS